MRRRSAEKREVQPDPKFNNPNVMRFVNIVMIQGKKSIAENIVYGAFDILAQKTSEDAMKVFNKATRTRKEHPAFAGRPDDITLLPLAYVTSL